MGKTYAKWVQGNLLRFYDDTGTKLADLDFGNALIDIASLKLGGVVFDGSSLALSGLTASAADLNAVADQPDSHSTITLSAGGGTTQTATIQLKDADNQNVASVRKIRAYMCTDAAGATPSTAGANTSVTATTGAILKAITAKLDFDVVTDNTGKAVLVFNNGGGGGAYTDRLVLVLPFGAVVVSGALNVATA